MKEELKQLEAYERRLTVSHISRESKSRLLIHHGTPKSYAFIRLCGKWLNDAGFYPHGKISVKVEMRKLIIEALEKG